MDQLTKKHRKRLSTQVSGHNKRAKDRGIEGVLKLNEWIDVVQKTNGICHYCHDSFTYQTVSLDHIIPLGKGGLNIISNVQAICLLCNGFKHTKDQPQLHIPCISCKEPRRPAIYVRVPEHGLRPTEWKKMLPYCYKCSKVADKLLEEATHACADEAHRVRAIDKSQYKNRGYAPLPKNSSYRILCLTTYSNMLYSSNVREIKPKEIGRRQQ